MADFSASAAWLSFESNGEGEARATATRRWKYFSARGESRALLLSDNQPASPTSAHVRLPFGASQVRWAGIVSPALATQLRGGVVLQTRAGEFAKNTTLEITEIEALDTAASPARWPMPPGQNSWEAWQLQSFGVEDRALAKIDGDVLRLSARAGKKPAGIILKAPAWYLPASLDLKLETEFQGTGEWTLAMADEAAAQREEPFVLGRLVGRDSSQKASFSLPPDAKTGTFKRSAWRQWIFLCPPDGGHLAITSLKLQTVPRTPTRRVPPRAAWVWEAGRWQKSPEHLLQQLMQLRIGTVYITVPIDKAGGVENSADLRRFIERARKMGIEVWAVEGDPHAIFPAARQQFVQRAQAYARYNRRAAPAQRLSGVQYDIEPYILPGYSLDAAAWNREYLATIQQLKAALSMPLEVALPFWYAAGNTPERAMLEELAPFVDSVAVMNYRTQPALMQQFAMPFLEWGEAHRKPVRIALEAGPLPDEERAVFRPAPGGELWLCRVAAQDVLLLLQQAQPNPAGPAFRLQHSTPFSSSNLTFHANKAAARQALPTFEQQFTTWKSFAGLALHEFMEP
jgi:hypothetical protein